MTNLLIFLTIYKPELFDGRPDVLMFSFFLFIARNFYELFHNTKNGTVKIIITERYHYYGLHKYYNLLGKLAKGKLLILWNTNIITDSYSPNIY